MKKAALSHFYTPDFSIRSNYRWRTKWSAYMKRHTYVFYSQSHRFCQPLCIRRAMLSCLRSDCKWKRNLKNFMTTKPCNLTTWAFLWGILTAYGTSLKADSWLASGVLLQRVCDTLHSICELVGLWTVSEEKQQMHLPSETFHKESRGRKKETKTRLAIIFYNTDCCILIPQKIGPLYIYI